MPNKMNQSYEPCNIILQEKEQRLKEWNNSFMPGNTTPEDIYLQILLMKLTYSFHWFVEELVSRSLGP